MNLVRIKLSSEDKFRIFDIGCDIQTFKNAINEYNRQYNSGEFVDYLSNNWLIDNGYGNVIRLPTVRTIFRLDLI